MAKRKMSVFERLHKGVLNRNERRILAQKVAASDPGLSIVHPNAAGIDVGNGSHFVAVPADRDSNPVREFGSWTAALREMAEWLIVCRIDTVAMQSTGVYWVALYDVLTSAGLTVVLVNARDTKNVPGRKTDVQECQWLMKLHTYGLLRNSFHLAEEMQCIRTLWRARGRHVAEAAERIQLMQKALTKMNVQLANTLSDISGKTGMTIIGAILEGKRDRYELADLADPQIQASRDEIAHSLEGNWREDVLFELRQALDGYHFAHRQMAECDRQLEQYLSRTPSRVLENPPAAETKPMKGRGGKKSTRQGANIPKIDLSGELKRICGVDLTSIDGIGIISAMTIVSEIGTDLSAFPSEDQFANWLGLAPNNSVTGGKRVKAPKRRVKNRIADVLRMAATSLLQSHTYLGARYRQFRRTLKEPPKAVKAMAHRLALLVYRLMTKGQAWIDWGAAQFEKKKRERDIAYLINKAQSEGYRLVPITEPVN